MNIEPVVLIRDFINSYFGGNIDKLVGLDFYAWFDLLAATNQQVSNAKYLFNESISVSMTNC